MAVTTDYVADLRRRIAELEKERDTWQESAYDWKKERDEAIVARGDELSHLLAIRIHELADILPLPLGKEDAQIEQLLKDFTPEQLARALVRTRSIEEELREKVAVMETGIRETARQRAQEGN